ncbi:hypothetical protein L596_018753 [Steinernema carpocapsae]|uniref:SKP1 component POZ domain-containing protein n=1 Tax=Steinernema carpocapsae TaxID=34508 RepID=A0A4U5N6B6_STECR|nr:hypothetical protein L596_018753 [Steinernema carpocapsae]
MLTDCRCALSFSFLFRAIMATVIFLKSEKSGDQVQVEESLISRQSPVMANMFENTVKSDEPVSLRFSTETLRVIAKWCQIHANSAVPVTDEDMNHDRFIRTLQPEDVSLLDKRPNELAEIIKAAHFLEMNTLLNAACKMVSKHIEDISSTEDIKKYLNL